jgi:hypothetical protein
MVLSVEPEKNNIAYGRKAFSLWHTAKDAFAQFLALAIGG